MLTIIEPEHAPNLRCVQSTVTVIGTGSDPNISRVQKRGVKFGAVLAEL